MYVDIFLLRLNQKYFTRNLSCSYSNFIWCPFRNGENKLFPQTGEEPQILYHIN